MPNLHPAEVKAGAIAALLAGMGIREVARTYSVPKSTVMRWRDDVIGTDVPSGTGQRGTRPAWAPDPDEGDFWYHLERLGKEYIVGVRTCVRYLSDPDVLTNLDPDGYSAVVGAHDSLASRVAGLLQVGGAVHQQPPALPSGSDQHAGPSA